VALEARCAGVKKTFQGNTEILYVNGTDMPSVRATITAKLKQDNSIDYVTTLGAPFAMTAIQSIADAGTKTKLATFDLNKDAVGAIKSGKIQWAVDQQPYLQGYLSIDSLWLYKTNGNYSGGGEAPVLTGPAFVDRSNVDKVAQFAAKGTR
jgi:simple sugar transport system substrate-binding protein